VVGSNRGNGRGVSWRGGAWQIDRVAEWWWGPATTAREQWSRVAAGRWAPAIGAVGPRSTVPQFEPIQTGQTPSNAFQTVLNEF
jgi:hypothetical protein